ncbi:hypothetical protein Tel_13755 [Candidatus Tenderia electrophaga]|jgi:putative PEP-CTERM system TPR-repeat lipoprotein|uniref:Uncharacterized protein n=1 Tax=Candidatus Tenderia electrophaga TaxID=1748243 RepID=A0A0S2TG45_9GAMM|nr:hypothetical protein Tel_13755 [Candidatus Tenderia electrophaga]
MFDFSTKNSALTFITLLLPLLLAACSTELSEQALLERAKDHLDKGELRAASIQLKNTLQQNPENPEARWLLGNVHLDMGDPAAAEKELKRARELGVVDESVRPLLARSYASQGKYDDVLALPIEGLSPKAQTQILAAQATALIAQNRYEEAQAKVERTLALQPDSTVAVTEQARLALARNELEHARDLLDKLLQRDDTHAPAWSLLSEIERREQRPEAAEAALTQAIENRFNNVIDRLKRALVRVELKKYDAAQADIDKVKKRIPNYYELHYVQGLVHYYQQRYPQAQAALELALKANDQFMPALFYLGATHHQLGQREQAENLISRFVAANAGFIPGRKLLAEIRLQEGDFAAVERLLRPVVNANGEDVAALNLLAIALIQQGKRDEGVSLLEKIVALQPDSADAYLRLGAALLAQDNEAEGIRMLDKAVELDPERQATADKVLIRHYLDNDKPDQALAIAQSYRQRNPEQADAHIMFGLAQLARDETEAAKAAFNKARQIESSNITANQNLAALALSDQDYAAARQYYEAILAQHADHLDTLMKLALLDDLQQRPADMVTHLEQAIAAHPEAVQPRTSLARHHLANGEPEKVAVALGDLSQTRFDHPEVVEVLGRAQLAQRASGEAHATLARLVALQPESAQAHYLLSLAYAQLDNLQAVRKELEQSTRIDRDYLPAHLALTRLLLSQGDTAAAQQQLDTLKRLAPGNPDVLALQGRLARASGQQDKALDIYAELFENNSTSTNMLALVQQRWESADRQGAMALLKQWLQQHPDDLAARLRLANAYTLSEQDDAAAQQYQAVLERSPNNLVALNNLAWHLQDSDPKQALQYAEKADTLAPGSAGIRDTLAVVLMKNGQHERALRISDTLLEKHPDDAALTFHRAMILAGAGRGAEAEGLLTELLQQADAFPERAAAEALLSRLRNS